MAATLGPCGMDKLIVDGNGKATISNDGATIAKLLEVGDGTTSVVLLAGELLKLAKPFVEDGVGPQIIIRGYQSAWEMAVDVAGKE